MQTSEYKKWSTGHSELIFSLVQNIGTKMQN